MWLNKDNCSKSNTNWTLSSEKHVAYNGYKQIAEHARTTTTMHTVWQPENSGDFDVPLWSKTGTEVQTYIVDGNKNIRQLKNAAGTVIANYDYDPFGNVTATGSVTPWQFSSEYRDEETGLVYYNYRYYAPTIGRWINRDPIEEKGGVNLYEILHNSITMSWDSLGYWDGLLPWIFRKIFGNIQFNTLCECGYIIKRRIEYQGDGCVGRFTFFNCNLCSSIFSALASKIS